MNSASESLLQAIDLLVDKRVGLLKFDKTIQAEIYSIVDLDTGEYQVKYAGNVFSAFAQDTTKSFSVGDNVYVTVPEGDFDNKKMITGLIRTSSLSYSEINEINSLVVESSPTFDNMYEYSDESEYGVIAGAPSDDPNSKFVIFEASGDTAHNLFAQYALTNELIRIRASFLTRFHMEHVQGNYGLEIEFFTKGDPISFRLDVSSFLGNPYSYTVYSPQTVIVQVPMGHLTGLKSITLFEENFVYDRYVENGIVTDKENRTNANIFVSDILLGFVKTTDALDNLYYLDILAPQGRFLTNTTTSIDLVGRLIYSGLNIMNESNCTCKWFERDVSVMVGDEEYDKDAGVGWKPIETYIFNTLTVSLTDVLYKKEYKLVVLYNNSTLMSATVDVQNLTVGYDFELIQDTRGEDLVLYISDTDLVGDWYVLYPDGNYLLVQEKVNLIIVNNFLNYSSVTFYCGVYDEAETRYIAALAHTITASESEDDITISYVGEDTFRYDANGDISIEDSERERTLQVTLAWRDGVATSYTVDWIGPDGLELSSSMYNPTESMMELVWIDNSNILHYHIKLKYKVNYTNNTFTVRITTIDGNSYSFLKEILFLKDGDQGTNGTTYVVAVRPCDANGTKLAGFNPLVYYNGAWSGNLPLRCYVYKDGELINGNSHYTLQYTWTPHNVNLTPEATGMEDRLIASGLDTIINTPIAPYVTVEVAINDLINGRETSIYAYYPLDVAVNYSANEIDTIDISSIPSYIKYTSGGTNPQFYSNNIEFIYNGTSYSQYITSLNTDILLLENNEGLIYLLPASSFIFENTLIPMLRCAATDNATSYVLHPIVVYLDTYGNENINGWDGQLLVIDKENGEYIFAPLIGAGTKDSLNRFTGVVMGLNSSPNVDRNNIIGLYGYNSGLNTFGLLANGKAYFGTGNGRIVIDGSTGEATISGGGGGNSASGMTITLNNASGSADTQAIRIGNGNFYVTYGGLLNATGAVINGTITAAAGSHIGGWIIGEHDFHSESSGLTYVALNSLYVNTATENDDAYYAIWAGRTSGYAASLHTFAVTKTGVLYARDATIKGDITADTLTCNDGTIGGWIIDSNGFRNSSNTVYLRNNGSMKVGDNFSVSSLGVLKASGASISGTITATGGTIGGWSISDNSIHAGSTYLYSSGKIVATDADISGTINATTLTCNNGTIGGWYISQNGLSNSGSWSSATIQLSTTGGLSIGSRFSVSTSGALKANNATLDGTCVAETFSINYSYYGTLGTLGYIRMSSSGSYRPVMGITSDDYPISLDTPDVISLEAGDLLSMQGSVVNLVSNSGGLNLNAYNGNNILLSANGDLYLSAGTQGYNGSLYFNGYRVVTTTVGGVTVFAVG